MRPRIYIVESDEQASESEDRTLNDSTLIEAYRHLAQEHQASVDDILETPEFRQAFLQTCRHLLGNIPERELLHRLVYLRKHSRLPRSRDLGSV
jgi:hypothetical protein